MFVSVLFFLFMLPNNYPQGIQKLLKVRFVNGKNECFIAQYFSSLLSRPQGFEYSFDENLNAYGKLIDN